MMCLKNLKIRTMGLLTHNLKALALAGAFLIFVSNEMAEEKIQLSLQRQRNVCVFRVVLFDFKECALYNRT